MFDASVLFQQNEQEEVGNALEFISADYNQIVKATKVLRNAYDEIREKDLLAQEMSANVYAG